MYRCKPTLSRMLLVIGCAGALLLTAGSAASAQCETRGMYTLCPGAFPLTPDPFGYTSHPFPRDAAPTPEATYGYGAGAYAQPLYGQPSFLSPSAGPAYPLAPWYSWGPYAMGPYYPGPYGAPPAGAGTYGAGPYGYPWGAAGPYGAGTAAYGSYSSAPTLPTLWLGTPSMAGPSGSPAGPSPIIVTVDGPGPSSPTGRSTVRGWAVDVAASSGTGVASLRAYLDTDPASGQGSGAPPAAAYGLARPDVAEALGEARFAPSGFEVALDLASISPGQHTLYIVVEGASGSATVAVPFTLRAS